MVDVVDADPEVLDLAIEGQVTGEHLIRVTERSQRPLTDAQYSTLAASEERIKWFNLKLSADLDGVKWLQAGNRVGTYRFTSDDSYVFVQVDPKVESADVFRMLDRTNRSLRTADDDSELAIGDRPVSGMFLQFFATRTKAFLERSYFRTYRFVEESAPGKVKGRPLIREYLLRNIPQGKAHILPTRHLDFTVDVFENRVIAYTVQVASRLVGTLGLSNNADLRGDLQACSRLLAGVTPTKITAQELRSYRHNRATKHFEPIHQLCLTLLENQTVTFDAGDRIPFAAFSLNMPNLFERYVAAAFSVAIGASFIGDKRSLEFPTGFGGKPIKLDGLAVQGLRRVVVEAKYRTLDETDDDLVLGLVPEKHVYQTVAYSSHEEIRARQALIVYPTWEPGGQAARLSVPITDFGWSRGDTHHLEVRLLGIDLAAPFQRLAAAVRKLLEPLISVA
jgi:5-methylcytosine-specific restriction endonuclease McrBC regulatory subunit McrC